MDEIISDEEPFKVIKTEPERAKKLISTLVTGVYEIGEILQPFMPETSRLIIEAVIKNKKPENLFGRLES